MNSPQSIDRIASPEANWGQIEGYQDIKKRGASQAVGPAVNEVARLAALCRSVDQPILISSAFAASVVEARRSLVSVGRFSLRGVGDPRELYTLDARG
jgi:adenylate cyclase